MDNSLNILQVTSALEQGGVERGTLEMASFIVSQGAKSFVASQGGRLVSLLESQGSTHFRLPLAWRNPLSILYSALNLKKIILREHISIVHARSRAPAWAALFACRMTNTPFITTFHGTHRIQNRLKKLYNSSMVRGERVIAISHFIKNHIIENYQVDPALIDVAPRGFNPAIFNPDLINQDAVRVLKNSIGLPEGVPILSLPGRLTRWKGQVLFLNALAQVKDLPWRALIVGGAGKKAAYLEELKSLTVKTGLSGRVFYIGDQPDIAPYYALSDVVISASTEPEAFGRVAVEAQAMRKPVIVSAHGGSLETVINGETGWYFTNGDAHDLANKIRLALGSEDLDIIGKNARKWVLKNFTIDRMCQAEWAAYLAVRG